MLACQMEVFAGFLEHTDHHIGRLLDALAELEILDDTLVYYIIGDNGASAEGTLNGSFNELLSLTRRGGVGNRRVHGVADRPVRHARGLQPLRAGWAHAMDTPISGPSRWPPTGRDPQRHHPPLASRDPGHVEVQPVPSRHRRGGHGAGGGRTAREPTSVHGVQQQPLHGVSMAYSFDDADAAEQRETQYFELAANRGIYHKGWTAVTRQHLWEFGAKLPAFDDDVWELYDTNTDWTQAHDRPPPSPTSSMSCSGCSC